MKRAALVAVISGLLFALVWPPAVAEGALPAATEPAQCRALTPWRILENPVIAEDWAKATRAGPARVEEMRERFRQLRALHGCPAEAPAVAVEAVPAPVRDGRALPPGHPPVGRDGSSRRVLPPGHPPVPASPWPPPAALFDQPTVLEI